MLSSLPVSTTQIVVVIAAVLLIVGIGDAELVSRLTGWTGLLPPPTSATTKVNNDSGKLEAGRF